MKRLFALALPFLLAACTQIDTGNVGVESSLGQVKKEALPPGVYMTLFKKVTEVIAKEVPMSISDLKPQTSDKITLSDLDIDVYVKIDPTQAPTLYSKWPGDMTAVRTKDEFALGLNFVTRQAREAVFDVVSRQNSASVHTKRTEIAAEVAKQLQASLDKEAGKAMFQILSVNVTNLVTDPALEANIKAAAAAQFALQKEKNENEVAKQRATAAAELAILTETSQLQVAEAQAKRKRVEAQAEADAIRIKAESIGKSGGAEYVQLQAIAKWDGALPGTVLAGNTPFLQGVGK